MLSCTASTCFLSLRSRPRATATPPRPPQHPPRLSRPRLIWSQTPVPFGIWVCGSNIDESPVGLVSAASTLMGPRRDLGLRRQHRRVPGGARVCGPNIDESPVGLVSAAPTSTSPASKSCLRPQHRPLGPSTARVWCSQRLFPRSKTLPQSTHCRAWVARWGHRAARRMVGQATHRQGGTRCGRAVWEGCCWWVMGSAGPKGRPWGNN